jgi:hypothetical protein
MPLMFKESPQKAATVSLGDVTVEANQVTAGVQKQFRGDRNGANLVLPAGAYSIYLRHADATGGTITVNGEPIRFNGTFSKGAQVDQVNNKQDFVGEVTIDNPDGKTYWLDVAYPSSSSFNPNVI